MKSITKTQKSSFYSIREVCSSFDMKRDAYYKFKTRFHRKEEVYSKVIELVKKRRDTLPREGGRKLLLSLRPDFEVAQLKVGRDSLFDILITNNLLVKKRKYSCKTTNSYHRFHKYKNLIKEFVPTKINQVWVTDITYIRTVNGFCYLALVTDLFSRKIVGYDISNSLELEGVLRALKKALYQAKALSELIHHSDRGIQYCSNVYTNELLKRDIKISMTEENHCYENAVAERVNGILKDEFYLDITFTSLKQAKMATKNAIKLYNNERLHLSLNFKTPDNVYKNIA